MGATAPIPPSGARETPQEAVREPPEPDVDQSDSCFWLATYEAGTQRTLDAGHRRRSGGEMHMKNPPPSHSREKTSFWAMSDSRRS